ncbi:hypothetical protein ACOZ38_38115 [Sphaerisporangium viridialbum]|uniref:hypothetical protein n=1 Tax=Sphaerisporangium viridialbum TaxID=46189 RepID=UPI003C768D9C
MEEERPAGITRKALLKAALIVTPMPLLLGRTPALAGGSQAAGEPLAPTHPAHPREGAGAEPARAHDPALLPR